MAHVTLQAPLSREVAELTIRAVEAAMDAGASYPFDKTKGGRAAIKEAAPVLGITPSTLRNRLWRAWQLFQLAPRGIEPPSESVYATRHEKTTRLTKPPAPPRSEVRDSGFWKAKAAMLQKSLDEAERMAEALAGLRSTPISRVEWAAPSAGRQGRAAAGMLLSDIHMGEVIAPEEIAGINAFNPDICRARVQRYFNATCHVSSRLMSDCDVSGALIALAGDMISGDIHEELRITNALTSHEQVAAVIEAIEPGIRMALDAFGRVHVVSVPGNHSRVTHKPTAKLYSRASYDTLIAAMLSERFRSESRVTFQFGPDKDQAVNMFGFEHFITHGDKIGTRGGMGFAGPLLPIVRGAKKIEAQQASIGRKPDYIWHGHYHTTANAGNVLSNGSVPGYSEYASDLRAAVEPPQQWLAILHSHWGMRERVPIQLEDPQRVKPRVSVRAA